MKCCKKGGQMKNKTLLLLIAAALFLSPLFAKNTKNRDILECKFVEEADKLIQCTYYTTRTAEDRNITFTWRSANTPQDDREHTAVLKARHGSLYDYRYYYGRAYGEWEITATDDTGNVLSTTSFTIK